MFIENRLFQKHHWCQHWLPVLMQLQPLWPLGVAQRPSIERSVFSGHQVEGIIGLWSRQRRCVAKPAILYAHFWPVQAHTNTDQQLRAATGSCNCFSIVYLPFLPHTSMNSLLANSVELSVNIHHFNCFLKSASQVILHFANRNNNQLWQQLAACHMFSDCTLLPLCKFPGTIAHIDNTSMIWPKVGGFR